MNTLIENISSEPPLDVSNVPEACMKVWQYVKIYRGNFKLLFRYLNIYLKV